MQNPLDKERRRIDAIDERLLELLQERNDLATEILTAKIAAGLPIFDAERELSKVAGFRREAAARGLDAEWAEDFLRLAMGSSRAQQSRSDFPRCDGPARTVVLVGGGGQLGTCYGRAFTASGHEVRVLESSDWDRAEDLVRDADAVIITVPIRQTTQVIRRIAPLLNHKTVLADFTSLKQEPVATMLAAYEGPVLGLHPMHGPDVANLAKQLVAACPAREPDAADWLLAQFRLWGLRVVEISPAEHDRVMDQVQGLRHFVALLHGSFLRAGQMLPREILALSSPIYRAELMMTGRIFAQNAELYADIVFASPQRRQLLADFLDHHRQLADLVDQDDKEGFIREFKAVGEFFGDFAEQARTESGYLIHRLADRFV